MDTIFALASARGKSGVAVIRISGPQAHEAVAALTPLPQMRRASLRRLVWKGEVLDEAVVLLFAAGQSFTGEAAAELHVHGGQAVVSAVLRVLGGLPGLRMAEPGEFTRRALEHGRMDLAQVEGLADLIDAETESQRRQAMRVMSGQLGQKVEAWRRDIIRAAALIEATIDFADEDVPVDVMPEVRQLATRVRDGLIEELRGARASERVRDGFEVAIVGAPNAGKSTLLNALAGRDAAITSEIAGTTRDVIEVRMDIDGLAVTILDTAGLRTAADGIERVGIERAIKRAEAADLRIFLLSDPREGLMMVPLPDDIVIQGKSDLREEDGGGVSGKTGAGLSLLVERISETLQRRAGAAGLLIRERHRISMEAGLDFIESGFRELDLPDAAPEVVSENFRLALRPLAAVIGRVGAEDLLDEIFASFCIGK